MAKTTARQTVEISDLLKQHLQQLPDGSVEYTNDMTDTKIAKLVGVHYWNVTNVRRQLYGEIIQHGTKAVDKKSLQQQIANLQRRLDAIEHFMEKDWGYELNPPTQE